MKKPIGCKKCFDTGYLGRTVIAEHFINSTKLEEYISQKQSYSEIERLLKNEGMESLLHDGLNKVNMGITSFEELKREININNANL